MKQMIFSVFLSNQTAGASELPPEAPAVFVEFFYEEDGVSKIDNGIIIAV